MSSTTNTKVTSFSITIHVPIPESKVIHHIVTKDIRKHEKRFIELRDLSINSEYKIFFDQCRQILHLALKYEAELYSITNTYGINEKGILVQFIFSFNELNKLILFNNALLSIINNTKIQLPK